MTMRNMLSRCGPVMPVVVIDAVKDAVPLATALVAGGLTSVEVTLRTPAGVDSIAAIARAVPEIIAGAGTVVTPEQAQQVASAGAAFAVSPGLSRAVCEAANAVRLPMLPGVMTPSDIMLALECGLDTLKFFPASIAGGVPALRALAGPFAGLGFCPTGGINLQNASDYLALDNVLCVGGSWLASRAAIANGDWKGIEARAREAAALRVGGEH